jgi:hypothetical protein
MQTGWILLTAVIIAAIQAARTKQPDPGIFLSDDNSYGPTIVAALRPQSALLFPLLHTIGLVCVNNST